MIVRRFPTPCLPRPRTRLVWLVLAAHALTATGFPVLRSGSTAAVGHCSGGACGCTAPSAGGPGCCCTKPVGRRVPPPSLAGCCGKAETCPLPAKSCCGKSDPSEPVVTWVIGWQARQCKGQGPPGVVIADPAVPPPVPTAFVEAAAFAGYVPAIEALPVSRPVTPPVPPPKSV